MKAAKKTAQDKIRTSLRRLIEQHGVDMATVSRAIGKNHAYIQQYLTRGIPAELPDKTAMALARYFSIEVEVFGITGMTAPSGLSLQASNDRKKRHPVETIRRMMGLSLAQFADAVKEKAQTIEAIESGRAPLSENQLFKICQTFHVEPEDLREFVPQFSEEERSVIFQMRQMSPAQKKAFESALKKIGKETV